MVFWGQDFRTFELRLPHCLCISWKCWQILHNPSRVFSKCWNLEHQDLCSRKVGRLWSRLLLLLGKGLLEKSRWDNKMEGRRERQGREQIARLSSTVWGQGAAVCALEPLFVQTKRWFCWKMLLAICIVLKWDSKQGKLWKSICRKYFQIFLSNYTAVYKQIWNKPRSFQINHPISHFIVPIVFSIILLFLFSLLEMIKISF